MKKFGSVLLKILFILAIFLLALLSFTIYWTIYVWPDVSFDQIVFHITSPIAGTGSNLLVDFCLRALLPAVAVTAAAVVLKILVKKKAEKKVKAVNLATVGVLAVFFIVSACIFAGRYNIIGYFTAKSVNSDFIKDNYADPEKVSVTFPEKKRNLIYIFLESMEMTYADKKAGGALDYNCIPELTRLAMENDCFSGDKNTLNGARVSFGTTYTMGGMVAQSSGLPVVGGIGNAASQQDSFYPGATVLGDILKKEGYTNELMVGSPVEFGGRGVYYSTHGNHKLFDYDYALKNGKLPTKDYYVWWGYEDKKLFSFAKEELKDLSSKDAPFNLTLLTVDTHFEDGYVCEDCKDEFGVQYANVMACSSRQVVEFVNWCKQQDFYENTTIVLNGDHLTMDKDFLNSIDAKYDRKTFTAIINPAVTREDNGSRLFCTLDLFPTTLAAMGCKIEGDRLGLGTNLYSSKKTLFEEYGEDFVNAELSKNSEFVNTKISNWDPFDFNTLTYSHALNTEIRFGTDGPKKYVLVGLFGAENINAKTKGYVARMKGPDGSVIDSCEMELDDSRIYNATLEITSLKAGNPSTLEIYAMDSKKAEHLVYAELGFFSNYAVFETMRKVDKPEKCDSSLSFSADGKTMTVTASGFKNPNDIGVVYVYVWDKRSVSAPTYYALTRVSEENGATYSVDIDISKLDRNSVKVHLYQRASGGWTKIWKEVKQ